MEAKQENRAIKKQHKLSPHDKLSEFEKMSLVLVLHHDKIQIEDMIKQYALNLDSLRCRSNDNMFAEDGVLSVTSGVYKGKAEIMAHLQKVIETTAKGKRRVMSNIVVTIDERQGTAEAISYIMVFDVLQGPTLLMTATYQDELKKICGEWKFQKRTLVDPCFKTNAPDRVIPPPSLSDSPVSGGSGVVKSPRAGQIITLPQGGGAAEGLHHSNAQGGAQGHLNSSSSSNSSSPPGRKQKKLSESEKMALVLVLHHDKIQIEDMIKQYALNVDNLHCRRNAKMFAEDATLCGPTGICRGNAEILAQLEKVKQTTAKGRRRVMSNIVSKVDERNDTAEATSYMMVYDISEGPTLLLTAKYKDQLKKIAGEWKFQQRVLEVDCISDAKAAAAWAATPAAEVTARSNPVPVARSSPVVLPVASNSFDSVTPIAKANNHPVHIVKHLYASKNSEQFKAEQLIGKEAEPEESQLDGPDEFVGWDGR
eukprot:gb/GEZN01004427.1/.p1 GENE.gb/GEZN01004427.1/~~gb/GEZN01004427.1/.p1  ORF type:complete len:481 (-),score=72.75 gb/GEZN01004427.1/:455-1897(-)